MKAFTLIELIVTTAIIAIMALVSIPAFSRYGASSDFSQKTDQIKDALSQMYVKTLNPEKDVTAYYAEFNNESADPANTIIFYSQKGLNPSEISRITLPNGTTLVASGDGPADSPANPAYLGLYCDIVTKTCCKYNNPMPVNCTASTNDKYILYLPNTSISKAASLKIFSSPFTVTVTQSVITGAGAESNPSEGGEPY